MGGRRAGAETLARRSIMVGYQTSNLKLSGKPRNFGVQSSEPSNTSSLGWPPAAFETRQSQNTYSIVTVDLMVGTRTVNTLQYRSTKDDLCPHLPRPIEASRGAIHEVASRWIRHQSITGWSRSVAAKRGGIMRYYYSRGSRAWRNDHSGGPRWRGAVANTAAKHST